MQIDIVNQVSREKVEVNLAEANTAEQHRLLAAVEIDVGVLRHPFDARGLKVSPPLSQPLGVLMHSSHPLAERKKIKLAELQPYAYVHFQRHYAPGLYDELLDMAQAGGYRPSRILHGVRLTAALLTSESAIAFTTERLLGRRGQSGSGEFTWKPLVGEPVRWWTSAVCRANDWDRLTRMAITVIIDALQKHEHWVSMARPRSNARSASKKVRVQADQDRHRQVPARLD